MRSALLAVCQSVTARNRQAVIQPQSCSGSCLLFRRIQMFLSVEFVAWCYTVAYWRFSWAVSRTLLFFLSNFNWDFKHLRINAEATVNFAKYPLRAHASVILFTPRTAEADTCSWIRSKTFCTLYNKQIDSVKMPQINKCSIFVILFSSTPYLHQLLGFLTESRKVSVWSRKLNNNTFHEMRNQL